MNQETFVYAGDGDGVEVVKTGRTASKKIPIAGGREREMVKIEITPLDPDITWKKWVDQKDLFMIDASKEPK